MSKIAILAVDDDPQVADAAYEVRSWGFGCVWQEPEHPVRDDLFAVALHIHGSERFELEHPTDQGSGLIGDAHRARLGGLLHPGRNVDGVPEGGVFDP